jgi:hypothetical protein
MLMGLAMTKGEGNSQLDSHIAFGDSRIPVQEN